MRPASGHAMRTLAMCGAQYLSGYRAHLNPEPWAALSSRISAVHRCMALMIIHIAALAACTARAARGATQATVGTILRVGCAG